MNKQHEHKHEPDTHRGGGRERGEEPWSTQQQGGRSGEDRDSTSRPYGAESGGRWEGRLGQRDMGQHQRDELVGVRRGPDEFGPRQSQGGQQRYSNIFDHERHQREGISGTAAMSGLGQQERMNASFRGRGPKGYLRSDQRIKDEVCDKLEDADDLDPSEVTVEVERGEVKLSGTIDSRWARRYVEDLAYGVRGVKTVANQLTVESGGPSSERQTTQGNGQRKATGKGTETQTQQQPSGS